MTKTTVEVVLPSRIVGLIFADGSTISQIRQVCNGPLLLSAMVLLESVFYEGGLLALQISGAQVNFLDVRPGAAEAVVEISGTPEQTQSAQSLLQAFILRGQTSSLGYA